MNTLKLISFSGPDGVGKTTHINLLLDELRKDGESVEYIHMFSKRGSLLNRVIYSHRVFSRANANSREHSQLASYRRIPMLLLKLSLTILDSWFTYCYIKLKYKHRTIICDRYFYDNIVYIAASEEKLAHVVLHFSSLIPKPDVAILLYAGPEVLCGRKSGQNFDSLRQVDSIFKSLAAREKLVTLSTETEVGTLHNTVRNIVQRNS